MIRELNKRNATGLFGDHKAEADALAKRIEELIHKYYKAWIGDIVVVVQLGYPCPLSTVEAYKAYFSTLRTIDAITDSANAGHRRGAFHPFEFDTKFGDLICNIRVGAFYLSEMHEKFSKYEESSEFLKKIEKQLKDEYDEFVIGGEVDDD